MLTNDPFACVYDLPDGNRVYFRTRSGNQGRGRWWVTPSDQIRMLPRELPRDPFHGEIINAAVDGRLPMHEVPRYFMIPGVGLHHSLYTLTTLMIGYRQNGCQTFIVPEGMQEALSKTSLDSVGAWDVKMPYPYLYIALPGCQEVIWGGNRTQWHKVGGAFLFQNDSQAPLVYDPSRGEWVQKRTTSPHPGHMTLYIWGMENEKSEIEGDDASFYLTLDFGVMEQHGLDLEQFIEHVITNDENAIQPAKGAPNVIQEALGVDLPTFDSARNSLTANVRRTLRIIFNALLYMGSENADLETDPSTAKADKDRVEYTAALKRLKSTKKRKKVERKLESLPDERVVWVGRSTPTAKEMVERSQGSSPGRRTWVRGHWWPRKDTIRKRIKESSDQVEALQNRVAERREGLQAAIDVADRAASLTWLLQLEDELADAEAAHADLEADLDRKLRWVKPYIRNKDSGDEVKGHTYRL